jgi:type II secretory pathway component PulJ
MLRTTARVALLLVALWGGLAVRPAVAVEPIAAEAAGFCDLVQNGGFEAGGLAPDYWHRHPAKDSGGNRLLRDTTVAHRGRASGLIVAGPLVAGAAAPNLQWNRYGIPVEGGSALILSCYAKAQGTVPLRAGCHFYGENHRHLGFQGVSFPDREGEWVYLRETVDVPDEAQSMGFVLYANPVGRTWYDDVAVLGTPSARATHGTPRLDGRFDDACWTAGQAITQFVVQPGTRLPSEPTRAWVAYDDAALYVAFHCPHAPGAVLREAIDRHDGPTWRDDSVEVFLDPNHDHRHYFHLAVNCRGQIRDARGGDPRWESAAEAAVERSATAWNVEIKIPYERLEIDLRAGAAWGINLARNDRVHGETSTWSLDGFHNARRFGNVALAPNLWPFRRAAIAAELSRRHDEMEQLRRTMREAGMTARSMSQPERLLAAADERMERMRRQMAGVERDTPAMLAEMRRSRDELAQVVPEARGLATQHMLATEEDSPGGFRLCIAHALEKVPRSGSWRGGLFTRRAQLDAAGDETESFQLIVLPDGGRLTGVSVETPPLTGPGGAIPIQWQRVDYVETIQPRYPTDYVGWWPDPLLPAGPFNVAADQRQPLWLSVTVPADARPGMYRGQVAVRHGRQRITVPVELRVRNFRLPRPGTLATAFGNYASVLAAGCAGKGNYRKTMPLADYARCCEFMGRYRLGPKNAGEEYTDVTRDGTGWRADLSALKATVGRLTPKYYAPYSIGIHRLPSAPQLVKPDQAPVTSDWAARAAAIAREWTRLGLPPQAYIYGVDEPRPDQYPFLIEAYGKLRRAVPQYPIMQTVNQREPTELAGLVGIWCPLANQLGSPFYAERLKAGDRLWAYVCCGPTPPYANFFVDRPATEHRVLFWQTWQHGATGFLYWCLCYWQGLPTPGSGKPCWPDVPLRFKDLETARQYKVNGDGVLLYPGPDFTLYPSLRLEVIRDGIEDYEYLALLRRVLREVQALPAAKRPPAERLAKAEELCRVPAEISRSMAEYTGDPSQIFDRRRAVADMIESLNATLVGAHPADQPPPPTTR